jgi:hypothetical protein
MYCAKWFMLDHVFSGDGGGDGQNLALPEYRRAFHLPGDRRPDKTEAGFDKRVQAAAAIRAAPATEAGAVAWVC